MTFSLVFMKRTTTCVVDYVAINLEVLSGHYRRGKIILFKILVYLYMNVCANKLKLKRKLG